MHGAVGMAVGWVIPVVIGADPIASTVGRGNSSNVYVDMYSSSSSGGTCDPVGTYGGLSVVSKVGSGFDVNVTAASVLSVGTVTVGVYFPKEGPYMSKDLSTKLIKRLLGSQHNDLCTYSIRNSPRTVNIPIDVQIP